MDTDKCLRLLTRELEGVLTAAERAELDAAAAADPELALQRRLLQALWQERRNEQDNARQTRQAFENLVQQMKAQDANLWPEPADVPVPPRRPRAAPFMKAAAILLLLAGAAYMGSLFFRTKKTVATETFASKRNGKGSRSRITLTDGSRIWLNADSELKYPESFEGSNREVFLTGEAFFEIAPDAAHPFIIHTEKMDIRVLGTSFNIRSYPEDVTHAATLVTGAIAVTLKDRPDASIRLQPKEKLIIPNKGTAVAAAAPPLVISRPTYLPKEDSIMAETAWMNNRLVFNGQSFKDLAREMERWYNITIDFRNEAIAQLTFTGIFRNESLESALQALQLTEPFHYRIVGDHVIIY